jgi:hypothetical protein
MTKPSSCSSCEANETPGFEYSTEPDVGSGAPATLRPCSNCRALPEPKADPPVVTPRTDLGYRP